MRTAKRSGSWIITLSLILSLILSLAVSCESNDPPGNYSSIEGIYTCKESSAHTGLRQYPVEIESVKDNKSLYIISNFHNKGVNEFLFAELSGDTLRILHQAITDISVNGKGVVGSDFRSIHLNYVTDDGVTILDYFTIYNR